MEALPIPKRQLTDTDIVRLGRFVGNQLNRHDSFDLIDPDIRQCDHDAVILELHEILDPHDERRVPDGVDDF
jgi:hypothetical protein